MRSEEDGAAAGTLPLGWASTWSLARLDALAAEAAQVYIRGGLWK